MKVELIRAAALSINYWWYFGAMSCFRHILVEHNVLSVFVMVEASRNGLRPPRAKFKSLSILLHCILKPAGLKKGYEALPGMGAFWKQRKAENESWHMCFKNCFCLYQCKICTWSSDSLKGVYMHNNWLHWNCQMILLLPVVLIVML